jgi:hypothetical protein
MDWPPKIGDLLPRAEEAIGVRPKLAAYSLDPDRPAGSNKARGFELILGITLDSIDHLESAIHTGILTARIVTVRERPPYGLACAVDFPLRGVGRKRNRTATVRTSWILIGTQAPPRLTSAYIKS